MENEPSLRRRLVLAGMTLLERDGVAGMTLRKTAALAGVSHAAPAHHFDGLPGLLTAIAAAAFDRFVAAMESPLAKAPDDPVARLRAICEGYIAFAHAHPGLFHVMFQTPAVRRDDLEGAARAYAILRSACLPFSVDGQPDAVFETAVWSLVHGYATLGFAPGDCLTPRGLPGPDFARCLDLLLASPPLRSPSGSVSSRPTVRA